MNSSKEGLMFTTNKGTVGQPSLICVDILQVIEGEIHADRCVMKRELHHIIPEVL
jgi:hypothetical protein